MSIVKNPPRPFKKNKITLSGLAELARSLSVFPVKRLQQTTERALLDEALGFDIVSGLELWQRVKY